MHWPLYDSIQLVCIVSSSSALTLSCQWEGGRRHNLIRAHSFISSSSSNLDWRLSWSEMAGTCSSTSWALVAGLLYLLVGSLLAVTLARWGFPVDEWWILGLTDITKYDALFGISNNLTSILGGNHLVCSMIFLGICLINFSCKSHQNRKEGPPCDVHAFSA